MERHRPRTKGIKNTSGVACHASSAIQLLYHAISKSTKRDLILLSTELVEKENVSTNFDCNQKMFLVELGTLFRDIGYNTLEESDEVLGMSRSSVDPSKFYNLMMPNVDVSHSGDAGNSLRVLLSTMRKALESLVEISHDDTSGCLQQSLANTILADLQNLFWKGEISHQIIGFKVSREGWGDPRTIARIRVERRKQRKFRPLSCPLPIPLKRNDTIHSSLESVLFSKTEIAEYNWDILDSREYNETKETMETYLPKCNVEKEMSALNLDDCDARDESSLESNSSSDTSSSSSSSSSSSCCSSDDESSSSSTSSSCSLSSSCWKTFKQVQVQNLPEVLILQLPRSEYVHGRKQLSTIAINLLYELELDIPYKCLYRIDGAIVYQDDAGTHDLEPLDHGHYVCYFKEHDMESNQQELWKKVDDDKVTMLVVDDGISVNKKDTGLVSRNALCRLFGGKTRNHKYFATLLMYKLINKDENLH